MKFKIMLFLLNLILLSPALADTNADFLTLETPNNNYWTPQKLERAKPMSMPVIPSTQSIPNNVLPQDAGMLKAQYSTSRVIPSDGNVYFPYATIGKLFFTTPQGDRTCSATVIGYRIILTAGHCVHSGSNGKAGFYKNWLFIPAYLNGIAPFEAWESSFVSVTTTWAKGNGIVPNGADYAMLEMKDLKLNNVMRRIGTLTGFLGYQTSSLKPNHAHILGYACNIDLCQQVQQTTAQSFRSIRPNNIEYGSNLRDGADGGPFIQNFGEPAQGQTGGLEPAMNKIIGVISYSYTDPAIKTVGSSILDIRFVNLYNNICMHQANNCN